MPRNFGQSANLYPITEPTWREVVEGLDLSDPIGLPPPPRLGRIASTQVEVVEPPTPEIEEYPVVKQPRFGY